MTDDDAAEGDVAPGRPDHPARSPAGEPTPDEADERYLTGDDADEGEGDADADAEAESEPPADDAPGGDRGILTRLLDRVPAWVADLGAGCLLAATLITFVLTVFAAYNLATGGYGALGVGPTRLLTMVVVFGLATVFQGLAVRWARQRVRWMWVMLATAMGMLSIVGTPFALPAAVCLFVSKRHFAVSTPADLIGGGTEEEETGEAGETAEADAS